MTKLKVSIRAKEFVENRINTKDEIIKKIILYYLTQRHPTELLKEAISKTKGKDKYVIDTCDYMNILPPISQNLNDFSYSIICFINTLFDEKQINNFSNKEAICFLQANEEYVK